MRLECDTGVEGDDDGVGDEGRGALDVVADGGDVSEGLGALIAEQLVGVAADAGDGGEAGDEPAVDGEGVEGAPFGLADAEGGDAEGVGHG